MDIQEFAKFKELMKIRLNSVNIDINMIYNLSQNKINIFIKNRITKKRKSMQYVYNEKFNIDYNSEILYNEIIKKLYNEIIKIMKGKKNKND